MSVSRVEHTAFVTHVNELQTMAGVTKLALPAGQVLVYQGHFARGLFLVVKGSVCVRRQGKDAGAESEVVEDAGAGPLVVPRLLDLDQPATATVETQSEVEVYYIPRSVALGTYAQLSWLAAGTQMAAGA